MSEPAINNPMLVPVSDSSSVIYYPDDAFALDVVSEDGSTSVLASSQCDIFADETSYETSSEFSYKELHDEALGAGIFFTCGKRVPVNDDGEIEYGFKLILNPIGMNVQDFGVSEVL